MKEFEVVWTNNAQLDLELIIKYIQMESLERAKNIFFEIKNECASLQVLPKRKRIVPELQQIGIVKYRELIHKRWRIIFKIESNRVYVLIVVDSSRNLEDILLQRLLKK